MEKRSRRRSLGGRPVLTAAAVVAVVGTVGVLAAVALPDGTPAGPPGGTPSAHPLTPADCPPRLVEAATCYADRNDDGSYYTVAVPDEWNGSLVVHAHGGPSPSYDESDGADDLEEWAVMVDEGYAWVGSSYRRGGYGVRMAAEDTENARLLFVDAFGRPERTYLHGQSWGGNVAAKVAETYGRVEGAYDGVLLTNGLLGGGSRGYDHRVDLRVVYQYYCENLPLPTEEDHPLWQGLPADSTLTIEDVGARVDECTGLFSEPDDRTARQQADLDDILAVTGLSEDTLDTHMMYATFLFQDIVWNRLDGRNPFGNEGVEYSGSRDDRALNAGVARFAADPDAVRDLSYDSDLTGEVSLPVLTLHAIGDRSVFVEHEAAYRATLEAAGNGDGLVQTFTTEDEHNGLSDAEYAASLAALNAWAGTGDRPTPASVARSCEDLDGTYGGGCSYDLDFTPEPLHTRIAPRPGGTEWPAMTATQEREWSRVDGVGIAP
jgi:hypothetical protein